MSTSNSEHNSCGCGWWAVSIVFGRFVKTFFPVGPFLLCIKYAPYWKTNDATSFKNVKGSSLYCQLSFLMKVKLSKLLVAKTCLGLNTVFNTGWILMCRNITGWDLSLFITATQWQDYPLINKQNRSKTMLPNHHLITASYLGHTYIPCPINESCYTVCCLIPLSYSQYHVTSLC